jgi:hypothetical protein
MISALNRTAVNAAKREIGPLVRAARMQCAKLALDAGEYQGLAQQNRPNWRIQDIRSIGDRVPKPA